jgi:AcrR family transcriptional regulator
MKEIVVQPRKRPVQARSRKTVEDILAATAQVLVARGFDGLTTGAAAERAGVSIGTLYQYFPNKESLVDGLVQGHVADLLWAIDQALAASADVSLNESVPALVQAGIDAHRVNPELHKVLVEQVPRRGILAHHLDVSRAIQERLESELRRRTPRLSAARARMTAFVLETCVEALTHRAVIEAPDWIKSGMLEREATILLRCYLTATVGD